MASTTPTARTIPDPKLFNGLSLPPPDLSCSNPDDLGPSLAECLVHLELLGCFATLRQKVENCTELDTALELTNAEEIRLVMNGDSSQWHLKFERWKRFVGVASWRFYRWWESVVESKEKQNVLTRERMPPLDVLLGLHTFLLNPRAWHDYCYGWEMMDVWRKTAFDWKLIHELIDNYDFSFNLPEEAVRNFQVATGHKADLFEELRTAESSRLRRLTTCLYCKNMVALPYMYPLMDTFHTGYGIASAMCEYCAEQNDLTTEMDYRGLQTQQRQEESMRFYGVRSKSSDSTETPANNFADVLELPLGILRQGRFIHDIHTHNLMIRSPAVKDTVELGIAHMHHFFTLIGRFPKTMFVPTTHVDLAWHTLLLSPARYRAYTLRKTSIRAISTANLAESFWSRLLVHCGFTANKAGTPRFVDHNDKIGPSTLSTGRDITSWLHRKCFRGEKRKWRTCLCWECQFEFGSRKVLERYREIEKERRKEIQDSDEKKRIEGLGGESLEKVMEEKAGEVFAKDDSKPLKAQ